MSTTFSRSAHACILVLSVGGCAASRSTPPQHDPDLGVPAGGSDGGMTPTDGGQPQPLPDMTARPDMTIIEGLSWPATQQFPSFAPIGALDVIDVTTLTADRTTLVVTLAGLINRTRPRIYTLDGGGEGKTFWLDKLGATSTTTVTDPLALVAKYKAEIKGLAIYDDTQVDTINLATTVAGQRDGIVVSPALAATLSAAPYQLATIIDLRTNHFTSKAVVYQYEFDHYTSGATNRMIVGLNPSIPGNLRDYAVATKSLAVWLDPRVPAEKTLLASFLGLLQHSSPYLGWWPDEPTGVSAAANSAVPVFAADWSSNLTVLGGTPRGSAVTPPPPAPPLLENKIYVAMIMSDGDNVQEDQHLVPIKWSDAKRGQAPVAWTLDPALVDVAPVILRYFQSTATQNDVLVSGPSGLGYTYPAAWPAGVFDQFAAISGNYMTAAGFRAITVWNNGVDLSDGDAASYLNHMPGLLGLTIQDESRALRFVNNQLPVVRLAISYGDTAAIIESNAGGIDSQIKAWNHAAPMFVAVQGNMNSGAMTPSAFADVQAHYAGNVDVVFVRADHFFQLVRKANQPPQHLVFSGDFTGDGRSDALMYYAGDGNWWLGASSGTSLTWTNAGNSAAIGTLADGKHTFYGGDYNGDHKADLLCYGSNDGNWRLGLSNGTTLNWVMAGNTNNLGNLADGTRRITTGDYDGDGKRDGLFYYNGDGNWWMGLSSGTSLTWHNAGNTSANGNLLDSAHLLFDGDFNGDGKADVLFLGSDSNWWMGLSDGSKLTFHQAGNTGNFGNLVDGSHRILTGDYNGDGKTDLLFYYNGDGNWWMGVSDGNTFTWHQAGNLASAGNLLDWSHRLFVSDYSGDSKSDAAFYNSADNNFWLGASDGNAVSWHSAAIAQGNLLDPTRLLFSGDYNGDGKTDLLSYYSGDGGWTLGLSDGQKLTWQDAGNTAGYGDLTH